MRLEQSAGTNYGHPLPKQHGAATQLWHTPGGMNQPSKPNRIERGKEHVLIGHAVFIRPPEDWGAH